MATTEGFDTPNRRAGSVPMIDKDNSKVDWNSHSMLMFAHIKGKPGAFNIFKLEAPPVDRTDALEVENLNNWCYSVLVESCKQNATAMQQAQALFKSNGDDTWANTLWKLLESRFTKGRLSQVQEHLITLGKFLNCQTKLSKTWWIVLRKLLPT